MKKHIKSITKVVVLLVIGLWILSKIPFSSKINQEITAIIYENGIVTGETTVHMSGKKSNYLFSYKENYWGIFYIDFYEKTRRDSMNARISWISKDILQKITYSQNASFPLIGEISPFMLINKKMDKFALEFADGRIIATSEDVYHDYLSAPWIWTSSVNKSHIDK